MDKLFNSIWFVRILAFFIALTLFIMVNQNNVGSPSLLPEVPSAPYTIENEPLEVHYNEERFELVDYPETVSIELQGSQVSISLFQLTSNRSTEVFVDASEVETEGEHVLAVNTRNFPSDLSVSTQPQVVRIELREKQTASFPVHVELENTDEISEDQALGSPVVNPVNVDVTADRDTLQSIEEVKVFVDLTDTDKSIEEDYPVHFYDENGQEIDVQSDPNLVSVTVPITSPNKLVPVKMLRENELPDGLSIDDVTIEPSEVSVYGTRNGLEEIEFVESEPIDLSEIDESGEIVTTLQVPEDAERIDPEEVNVRFTIAEEEELEFDDVPIEIVGAEETVTFAEDAASAITITAYGTQSRLARLTSNDIQLKVDASGSHEGEQSLPLSITGPSHIRFELGENETKLRFSE
ncbi:CdaR family protein [Shouchella patagoniensis]|uniref:CdaR family protein n=1 Tax=Shouchella patagoniensis TaxID=228576 RepID=UPI000994E6C8|nr:CdaR family protein [Shouchella patagoniensis]